MAARSVVQSVNWQKLSSGLGLSAATVGSIKSFRERANNAARKVQSLSEQKTDIDFAHYRSVLKNQSVVDEIEKSYKAFKPVTYDVNAQIKAIEAFEAKAVENAELTAKKVDIELQDLQRTLDNIKNARPWEDVSVDDLVKAAPEIEKKTEDMVSRGRWAIKGYQEKFGDLSLM
ncbi:ATP synthase subunit D [Saitoella complicata NRRL Y-17804]|uniref:ATP synthase subunit D n=1 Tax=Saitoella complicata (strain BCRC 22490 / CBS 7301 / JCM 7358 / NBRC 10748 / NRRL Y-17804) TaxID=698492 RepID=UPI000867E82E|nr:ATP synthase subunit D [Saitoella complicata NRRL Y-17804]ODQ56221.1 ATP synthase subunit D [Saitoella complicata NRRL Y-17804]